MAEDAARAERRDRPASATEVFRAFLKLGLTSFGGPIAHLGYFRAAFVERRGWLSDRAFADLVALAQFLPGPASSQVGFAIGLSRAGWRGGLAAWGGFTLPSAALMLAFAFGATRFGDIWWGAGLLHGLQLAAVAVVAQAVLGMARTLAPDPPRAAIAVATLALLSVISGSLVQLAALIAGGLLGLAFCGAEIAAPSDEFACGVSRRAGLVALAAFFVLLALSLLPFGQGLALAAAFYRSGALVFGGGHVVLPLLRDAVVAPGWVSDRDFLSGYGAAQALPGPLFTVSAYLGATANASAGAPAGLMGALVALVAIFAPGLLALTGALPFWGALRRQPRAQAAMRGVNAAVVGLLGAALYNPLWTSAVTDERDFAVVAVAFTLLVAWLSPPLLVVLFAALAGITLAA
ncbi:MAG: chromate efflux transporter [Bradyrhizobium sp.]|nr:MAG: chromate efflux transporter [Bradyrhizobium sp.]